MTMTPDEAQQRLCHKIMPLPLGSSAPEYLCRGPGCMAWRWHKSEEFRVQAALSANRMQPEEGYCGLAGVPE